jgi:hypothetical protein
VIRLVTATCSRTSSSTERNDGDTAAAVASAGSADCAAALEACNAAIKVAASAADRIGFMVALLHA